MGVLSELLITNFPFIQKDFYGIIPQHIHTLIHNKSVKSRAGNQCQCRTIIFHGKHQGFYLLRCNRGILVFDNGSKIIRHQMKDKFKSAGCLGSFDKRVTDRAYLLPCSKIKRTDFLIVPFFACMF